MAQVSEELLYHTFPYSNILLKELELELTNKGPDLIACSSWSAETQKVIFFDSK
jgi:hypothetical protein